MKTAVRKAKETGIAYVGVFNSCHFGAAGQCACWRRARARSASSWPTTPPAWPCPARAGRARLKPVRLRRARTRGRPDPARHCLVGGGRGKGADRGSSPARHPRGGWSTRKACPRRTRSSTPTRCTPAVRRPQGLRDRTSDRDAGGRGHRGRRAVGRRELDGQRPAQPTHHGAAFLAIDVGRWNRSTCSRRVDA